MIAYKVIVSDRARRMMGNHVRFLAGVDLLAARALKDGLGIAVRSLEKMPERCPFLVSEYIPRGKYHKLLVEKRYLLLFQIKDQTVFVDYVVDCRQDYQWLIH